MQAPSFFSLHSPMAEADDLKSSQCGFESHWRHQFWELVVSLLPASAVAFTIEKSTYWVQKEEQ